DKGWVGPVTTITSDTTNFIIEYDYQDPKLYKIDPIGGPQNMHYIFEVRKREGFDLYIPEPPETYQYQPGTLLVWQYNVEFWDDNHIVVDKIRLKKADYSSLEQLNDFFPSAGYNNDQSLNDITLPAASLGDAYDEFLANYIRPAHFALNGIHKLGNGNTLIDEIKLNHAIVKNQNSGGWQLVSVSVGLTDYSLSSIFPTAISAYKWQSGYVPASTLQNGPGYWVNFPLQPQTLIQAGTVIEYLEIPVVTGWNITGTISDKVPVPNVCSEPPDIIGNIYSYTVTEGYDLLDSNDSLKPGIAYWTQATGAGNMILDRYAEPCYDELSKITSISEIDLSVMDKFIITDASGSSQTLYVTNVDIDTAMINVDLELPPFFEQLGFDSRFEYNEYVKKVSADSGTIDLNILVHTNSYPVSITWEMNPENGINYSFIGDSGVGKISGISGFGKTTFDQLTNNKIHLFAKVDGTISNQILPREFSLEQNYPNPFNPVTTIKYNLPKASEVALTIYDVLGREIKTIVNEQQQPGSYEVKWDASNVSSGIYFYQLKTNDYVDMKKMVLLK
ncbi:MAG TPA: T9SS type A sorting domain-containing protein, partial [Ignavibacteriaceae bacterium]|nr:T9SS type A sorting domain-containing protein [Ignavibacteriaceae bacterium]